MKIIFSACHQLTKTITSFNPEHVGESEVYEHEEVRKMSGDPAGDPSTTVRLQLVINNSYTCGRQHRHVLNF